MSNCSNLMSIEFVIESVIKQSLIIIMKKEKHENMKEAIASSLSLNYNCHSNPSFISYSYTEYSIIVYCLHLPCRTRHIVPPIFYLLSV